MSSVNPSTYSLGFRKPRRYDNNDAGAYIKHVRLKYRGSTRAEAIAAPVSSQQEGKRLDSEEGVFAMQDTEMYWAPSARKFYDLSNVVVNPVLPTSDDDTHAVRSSTKIAPSTQKIYGTMTGSDETRIHAGDHLGDFYDNRTTVNTTHKSNLTWEGIGADTLSRTVAGLALHTLSSHLAPRNTKVLSAQAHYAAIVTSSASTHAHTTTPEGHDEMKQAKDLSADPRAIDSFTPDSNVRWVEKCIKCCTAPGGDEFTVEEAVPSTASKTRRPTAKPAEERLDFHHQITTPHDARKEGCNNPVPVSKGTSVPSATQGTKQSMASSKTSTAASTQATRAQQDGLDVREQKGNVDIADAQCERKYIKPSEPLGIPPPSVFPKSCPNEEGSEKSGQLLRPPRREPIPRRWLTAPSDLDTQPGGESLTSIDRSLGLPPLGEDVREKLEKGFKLYTTKKTMDAVFRRGSVIAVFWHENLGIYLPPKFAGLRDIPPDGRIGPGWLSRVDNGIVYSHKRRFVLVNHQRGFSIGIPISTYGGKGLTSNKFTQIERDAHAIVYALGDKPLRASREPKFTKAPIGIEIIGAGESLSPVSRLYYGKPQSIEHNIKVKHVGFVIPEHVPRLLLDYRKETLSQLNL